MNSYDTSLQKLAELRIASKRSKDETTAMLKSVTYSQNSLAARQSADEATAEAARLEESIRAAAVQNYTLTGEKNPHPKVTVKIFKTFSVIDPARVLAWVKQNLADALIVDEKKVKAYVTKIGAVDGTQMIEEPKAQIATEL